MNNITRKQLQSLTYRESDYQVKGFTTGFLNNNKDPVICYRVQPKQHAKHQNITHIWISTSKGPVEGFPEHVLAYGQVPPDVINQYYNESLTLDQYPGRIRILEKQDGTPVSFSIIPVM